MSARIILALPYLYGLDRCIEANLRFYGYEVVNLCADERDVHYPHLWSRLKNLYHKHISHDGDYRKQLRLLPHREAIEAKLAAFDEQPADYALCIRANIYPKSLIAAIRARSRVCVNYQWDGIGRFPDILQYFDYFDRFFVFDHSDIRCYPQHAFLTASNFYFDYPLADEAQAGEGGGLYFLGGYDASRAAEMRLFLQQARRLHLPLDFHIYSKDERARRAFGDAGIRYLDRQTAIDFQSNLYNVRRCRIVADFVSSAHQGLSFRVFDAMRFGKKLISSNSHLRHYDFYRPENILIWTPACSDAQLAAFLEQPYQPLPPDLYAKYGFGNWLRYLLDIPPYQPITLPQLPLPPS